MENLYMPELIIDQNIRKLIPETSEDSIKALRSSIRKNGCRNAIIIWNNIIIDGYERYKICKSLKINFKVKNIDFKDIEDVEYYILKLLLESNFKNRSVDEYNLYKRYQLIKKYESRICIDINNHEKWCTQLNNKKLKLNKDNKLTLLCIAELCNTSTTCLKKVVQLYESDFEDLKKKTEDGKITPNKAFIEFNKRINNVKKENNKNDKIVNNNNENNNTKTDTTSRSVSFDFIKDELRNIFDLTVIKIGRALDLMKENDKKDLYNQTQLLSILYDNKTIIEDLIKNKFNKDQ